jgi:hypothetical protein
MALALRAVSSTDSTSSGAGLTLDIPAPSGLTDGDFMLWQVSSASTVGFTAPLGWSLVNTSTLLGEGASGNKNVVYSKVASGESGTFTFTFGTSFTTASMAVIAWYSTTAAEIAVDDSAAALNTPATTAHIAPSVSTLESNAVLHCFYSMSNTAAGTPDAGMTERWDKAGAASAYLMTAAIVAGATGTRTMTGANVTSAVISVIIAEVLTRFWPAVQSFYSIIYSGVDLTAYCTQGELEATYKVIETTTVADRQQQETPLRRSWMLRMSGFLDKALDDALGRDAVTRPATMRDLVLRVAEGYSQAIYTWTGTATVGAFIGNYQLPGTDPNNLSTWSADLAISGGPVRTEGA